MRFGRPFMLMTLGLAAAPLSAQTAEDHVALGVAAREARNPQRAFIHFEAALAADSMNYTANWQGALSLIELGAETASTVNSPARDSLYAMAEAYARRAVAARPDDADGHFALANALGRTSLTQSKRERIRLAAEIRTEALRAIELDGRHDGAYHILGRWHAEIMRLSGIQKFFAKTFLGGAVLDDASWEAAVDNMRKAVELDPGRIFHRLDLAEIYLDLDRHDEARAQLERVVALPPGDVGDERHKARAAELLAELR